MVEKKYQMMHPHLNEKTRRLWAGAEAVALGFGGVAIVGQATGISKATIIKGKHELQDQNAAPPIDRIRRPGGGRRPITATDPTITAALEELVDEDSRGDPESPLRWTLKSTRTLSQTLTNAGHAISWSKVAELLHTMRYSLQANRKTQEGKQHVDRDQQFRYINAQSKVYLKAHDPVISVDTKKKELVGNFKNSGTQWLPTGTPVQVNVHDFPSQAEGKAIPYGVYDLSDNTGYVNVGIDHDTAEFSAASIEKWWNTLGKQRYPKSTRLLITADSGGSNGARSRLWKKQLQAFSNSSGLTIDVLHFPPGTSKWNNIEHRLFSFIGINWKGKPLTSYQTIINLISSTQNASGLKVYAVLDKHKYPTGRKVSDAEMASLNLSPHGWHPDWNHTIAPQVV